MAIKKVVKKERYYNFPIERVWEALTDAEALSNWFMEADFEPEVGYSFTFKEQPRGGWDGVLRGEVLTSQPPVKLVYTWRGNRMKHVTRVTWELVKKDTGTIIKLTHSGFEGLSDLLVGSLHQLGWRRFLRGLSHYLDNEIP